MSVTTIRIGQPAFGDAQRKLEGSHRQWRLHLNQKPSRVHYCMLLRDSALLIKIWPAQNQWNPGQVPASKYPNLPNKMGQWKKILIIYCGRGTNEFQERAKISVQILYLGTMLITHYQSRNRETISNYDLGIIMRSL